MRQFLTVLFIALAILLGVKFRDYYRQSMAEAKLRAEGPPRYAPGKLPGLPMELEASLEAAKKAGAEGVRSWLGQHRQEVEDPRLADIQLDYVVLVGRGNAGEARRILAEVRRRVDSSSPVFKRLELLERVYQ